MTATCKSSISAGVVASAAPAATCLVRVVVLGLEALVQGAWGRAQAEFAKYATYRIAMMRTDHTVMATVDLSRGVRMVSISGISVGMQVACLDVLNKLPSHNVLTCYSDNSDRNAE